MFLRILRKTSGELKLKRNNYKTFATAKDAKDSRHTRTFRVDRSGLQGNVDTQPEFGSDSFCENKEVPSPLTKDLQSLIKLKGPLSLHDFMGQSLNHSPHGYYQHKSDKIGTEGDFITSPEISQLFGEMVGIWCYSVWESLGKPNKINLVELGPGKGTLMKDVLRVCESFKVFKSSLNVHMIELSHTMRRYQHAALMNGSDTPINNELIIADDEQIITDLNKVPVQWHSFLQQIPVDDTPIIFIGQEFLDAFPVHQFSFTSRGWREKLVDSDYTPDTPHHFRMVMSPNTTPAVMTLLGGNKANEMFRLLSKEQSTKQSSPGKEDANFKLILPEGFKSAPRSNSNADTASTTTFQEGDGIEMSPLSIALCEDISRRVVKSGGAALFIDYGEDYTQEDSLRAFSKHKQVNFLTEPGRVDITADVDFSVCARAAVNNGASVRPLSTQGDFLCRMGIMERAKQLLNSPKTSEEQGGLLIESLKKLVDPAEMGKRFKVLAITSPGLDVPGFE